jgi:hypothetical protein
MIKTTSPNTVSIKHRSAVICLGHLTPQQVERFSAKQIPQVVVMEGRPDLKNAQSNCRQLLKAGIVPLVITDNMAGFFFAQGLVKEVWVAVQKSDEGVLCPVGSVILSILAKELGIPLFGFLGHVSQRYLGHSQDLFTFMEHHVAPPGIQGYVPLVEWIEHTQFENIYD